MGTQVVKHTSRGVDITLNFASTENNLSWSFTQEGDGEIYEVSSTNIASYTVTGGAITLPYSVTNGSSYAVSIVKTTAGQTASITFKTRRSVNKSISSNIPDYGLYTGRYLYCLKNNNTILKYDTSLFGAANYSGAGVWITPPLVATIILPTNPDGSVYQSICFVKNGGVEKILAVARITSTGTTACYACYVRLSDNSVYDLTMTTLNTPTNITTYLIHTSVLNLVYDYVNEAVFLSFTGATTFPYKLDLTSLTNTQNKQLAYIIPTVRSTNYIIPSENKLSSIAAFNLSNHKSTAAILVPGSSVNSGWAFFAVSGGIITGSVNYTYQFTMLTTDAVSSTNYNITNGPTSVGSVLTRIFNNTNNMYVGLYTNTAFISWYQIGTGKNQNTFITDLASGQTGFYNACVSKYTGHIYAIGNTSLGRRRLFIAEMDIANQTTATRYIDTDADLNYLCTNQLIY